MKCNLPSGHPRCRRVYLSEQIWRYWESNENENPNSWEKHHNNPQVIHKTPVDHLMSCKVNTVAACHKTLNDWLESCGLLWCFYHLFELSFWRHPFTTEDTLVSKWCNAKFINLLWWRNKLIHILDRLRVTQFSAIFLFSLKDFPKIKILSSLIHPHAFTNLYNNTGLNWLLLFLC